MNIAITTSSSRNNYALVLINMLKARQCKPVCVISTERTKYRALRYQIKLMGIGGVARHFLHRLHGSDSEGRNYLREYALKNNIQEWNLPLQKLCNREGIEYFKVDSINSGEAVDLVKEKNIDVLLNAGAGIFRAPVIRAAKMGILNAHMGFLPTFRGMNVLEWSLFYDQRIGVTLHFIDEGIDTGDILLFKEIPREKGDTIATLRAKSEAVNAEIMLEGIEALKSGSISGVRQKPEDGKQYFVMHDRMKELVEAKLKRLDYRQSGYA
jgi:folate-dependent phosphoribosylglycinamide formyltransferase PurN